MEYSRPELLFDTSEEIEEESELGLILKFFLFPTQSQRILFNYTEVGSILKIFIFSSLSPKGLFFNSTKYSGLIPDLGISERFGSRFHTNLIICREKLPEFQVGG